MAFENFYMQTTGDILNAGSTSDNAALVTSTNGGWTAGTNTFAAAAGTPFSGVSAGEWVSLNLDAATTNTFIAEVASVGGGGASLVLHATQRKGTPPSDGATGRTCRVGGAWGDPRILNTSNLGNNVAPAFNTRLNVKAGTYAITESPLYRFNGSVTILFLIAGYNTTPGDLDEDATNALAKPIWSYSAGNRIQDFGSWTRITSVEFVGDVSGAHVVHAGAASFQRCRFENANASGGSLQAESCLCAYCYMETASTTSRNVYFGGDSQMLGCRIDGGQSGILINDGRSAIVRNIITGAANDGILSNTNHRGGGILYNTIEGCGRDGLRVAGSAEVIIAGNIFTDNTGYGINFSAAVHAECLVDCNSFWDNTAGEINQLAESLDYYRQTESADPIPSNFTPDDASGAFDGGFPGVFETESFDTGLSCGAVQPEGSGGSGGEVNVGYIG